MNKGNNTDVTPQHFFVEQYLKISRKNLFSMRFRNLSLEMYFIQLICGDKSHDRIGNMVQKE